MSACTKEIPFPNKNFERKMVLNSFVSVGEPIKVLLSETYSPSEDGFIQFINGATVNLLDSAGNVIDVLINDTSNGSYLSSMIAAPSTRYMIEAKDNIHQYYCTASTRTPNSKPSFMADTSRIFFQGNSNFFQFNIKLSDKPQEDNYYLFYCVRTYYEYTYFQGNIIDSILKTENLELKTNDYWFVRNENIQYSKKELLLIDEGFKGLVAYLKFGINLPPIQSAESRTTSITLFVSSLSQERYLYTSSLNEYLFYQSDPFSQTTSVFSNIKSGYGIFASDFYDKIEFEF